MADLRKLTATEYARPMGAVATVLGAPDAAGLLDVLWVSRGDDGREENGSESGVRWASNGFAPVDGDPAILFLDSQGDPWALVWASGAPV